MPFDPYLLVYIVPLAVVWIFVVARRRRRDVINAAKLAEAEAGGHSAPASLHPIIDPALCLGCAACVRVCPEGQVLGLINGKAVLTSPSDCIGHGACRDACPRGAISLVFGTATRGVEIPNVGPDFQTNVPGLYIAGELGGMGLIRNAIEQGSQAIASIARASRRAPTAQHDVIIVGGGPAGIAATLAAIEQGLRYITIEQERFGGTVAHFPKGKLVMTRPAHLPLYGMLDVREIAKEDLLKVWAKVMRKTKARINYGERVARVVPKHHGFDVETTRGRYSAPNVLLAIGRRGTPRRLDVPGEDLGKVVYRLVDATQYRNRHVLIVGGGDSAVEAACAIAEQEGTTVTLSHRGDAIARAKQKNRIRLTEFVRLGRIDAKFGSQVLRIRDRAVDLTWRGRPLAIENDDVIVCIGGLLPTAFLKEIGVDVEVKYGVA